MIRRRRRDQQQHTILLRKWPTLVATIALAFLLALVSPRRALAESATTTTTTTSRATFALIIGSNQSVDTNLTPLRYADDDAARYLDLFRLLGARTYLLTRLDENTRRLHPQAAAEANDPRKASFDSVVTQLIADVTQASQRGVETVVYFVYAGHGNVQNNEGYITLEDLRITGGDLARMFARVPASRIHVIADACASYFLAYSRGPGGERRPIGSFAPALTADPRIGLLLSTSSARESHEWDAFQSGVFSHEVRSGLYGAADADGDGQVSYREIAAFVARANARVPNERYRPDLHARAPQQSSDTLLDLRRAGRRIEIDGKHAGHYFLEDSHGVRIADVHNGAGQTVSLVRPAPTGRTYLRRVDDDKEFVIEVSRKNGNSDRDLIALADLKAEEPRTAVRGAAHESFSALFALPFDQQCVAEYKEPSSLDVVESRNPRADARPTSPTPPPPLRHKLGLALMGVGALTVATGAVVHFTANTIHENTNSMNLSQADLVGRNDAINARMNVAAACYIGGTLAFVAGIAVRVWPDKDDRRAVAAKALRAGAVPGGGYVGYGGAF